MKNSNLYLETENLITKDTALPRQSRISSKFKEEDIQSPDIVPLRDPDRRNYDDLVYHNIRKSCLHSVAARVPVLPCSETIG